MVLGVGRSRTAGIVVLPMRCPVAAFLGEGEWRATTAGVLGAGDFGAGFAMEGAFGETGATGCGASTGSATAGGGVLTLFSAMPTGVGDALTVFWSIDFLDALIGADRSVTAGGAMALRGMVAAAGVEESDKGTTGSVALGAAVRVGVSGADSVPDSATGSVADAAGDGVSAAVSVVMSALIPIVAAAVVSAVVSVADSVEVPTDDSALDSGWSSLVDFSATSATISLVRGGSPVNGCSGCGGEAPVLGTECAGAVDPGVEVNRVLELTCGDGASAALTGSTRFSSSAGRMTVAQARAPASPAAPIRPTARFSQGGGAEEWACRGCRFGGVSGGRASPPDKIGDKVG